MKPDTPASSSSRPPRLLDQVREAIRYRHYSLRTEQAYVYWVRAFVCHHGMRHPREMGAHEIRGFLQWLVSERDVAAALHQQALSALLFLYRHALMARLIYGSGVRLMACPRLRVKDIDLPRREIRIGDGKVGKGRVTVQPNSLRPWLRMQRIPHVLNRGATGVVSPLDRLA